MMEEPGITISLSQIIQWVVSPLMVVMWIFIWDIYRTMGRRKDDIRDLKEGLALNQQNDGNLLKEMAEFKTVIEKLVKEVQDIKVSVGQFGTVKDLIEALKKS